MTETKNYYTSSNYTYSYTDHTRFAGELSLFDFNGHHTMSSMADKIAKDLAFDRQCRLNAKNRDRIKNGQY